MAALNESKKASGHGKKNVSSRLPNLASVIKEADLYKKATGKKIRMRFEWNEAIDTYLPQEED